MIVLIPSVFLLLGAAAMLGLAYFKPGFRYHWLVAVGAAGLSWLGVWFLRGQIPQALVIANWGIGELASSSPVLLADEVSWPFLLALSTLVLAVILTDVGRVGDARWSAWAGELSLTALGLLAVMGGNILTFVMFWTVIDIVELGLLLRQSGDIRFRQKVLRFFAANLMGTLLVIWAYLVSVAGGIPFSFTVMAPSTAVLLLLAVGIRLGVLPLQAVFLQEIAKRRGRGTILRLVPPTSSLILAARLTGLQLSPVWEAVLLVLIGIAAVYGAVAWWRARDELRGRRLFVLAVSSLALASAVRGQQAACLAWSTALLYCGGTLFLYSARSPLLRWIPLLALLNLSSLFLTPTAPGAGLYGPPFSIFTLPFFAAQAYLLAGFARHTWRSGETISGTERWVPVVYTLGLAIMPVTQLVTGRLTVSQDPMPIWPGIVVLLGISAGVLYFKKGRHIPGETFETLDKIFSLNWLYTWLERSSAPASRGLQALAGLLEGEGGVLWAFLLISLLVSLIVQGSAGAGGL
ncbi:MAG: hypothetical protein OEY93_02150 [Anaerolineae bacterium]|nr:hypothetical protein [Anaerolineae bacterium]